MPRTGKWQLLCKLNAPSTVSFGRKVAVAVGVDNVPTLTPIESTEANKPSKHKVAAIVGGVGAALLLIIIAILVYICLIRIKKYAANTSNAASSATSPAISERGGISPYASSQSPYNTIPSLRQLSILELAHATKNFSESNIIGEGTFGLVYKGLLLDGSIVAIKRCLHKPFPDFLHKVKRIANVHHKHLVELMGYCEDNHQQFLVFDYVADGNVGSYLYDSEGLPVGKLDMRQRLAIASAAAKGLEYLHSLDPPLLHMHFRTSNVLLGDKFPKVSDYGVLSLVTEGQRASSSSTIDSFLDPELNLSRNHSTQSDVYSFGVFLLEIISGREANGKYVSSSGRSLVQEARECNVRDFVDKSFGERNFCGEAKMMELALQCVDVSRKRPSMGKVVEMIEQIEGEEMGFLLQKDNGEGIGSVALGSELFK